LTLGPEYFEKAYAASDDPWGFTSRWYEKRKYALTLAMLPRRRYTQAFEPGCSIGVLTGLLAPRCDRLLSWDISPEAVRQARERAPAAQVERAMIPDDWPPGTFDLIVFSEVLYYLGPEDLSRALRLGTGRHPAGGALAASRRGLPADR
jgi:SAM-dependent methyltransferase